MIFKTDGCAGTKPAHLLSKAGGVVRGLALVAAPLAIVFSTPATGAAKKPHPVQAAMSATGVPAFYAERRDYPLWLAPTAGDSADRLIALLLSAPVDGLDPAYYGIPAIRDALSKARASGKPSDLLRADRLLSQAFVAYVSDVRRVPDLGILWVDPQLKPGVPGARYLLNDVARASSPSAYLDSWSWMNPLYVALRRAMASNSYTPAQKAQIRVNMDRARVLPVNSKRYILVNAAEQKLFMVEDSRTVDSMNVVVGQVKWPTPMIVAYVRYAALNPYWYVPPDLAWEDVGEPRERYGQKYFDRMGYEIVTDWGKDGKVLDPLKVDWQGVKNGSVEVLIRQKPGPNNFMGRMKFMFPNEAGVYLHDNPRKELFQKDVRFFSGGCVRLSDAARLGRWMFGRDLQWEDKEPETHVMLDDPVPVYITYLTARPDGDGKLAFFDDAYGRDSQALAGRADEPVHAADSAVGSPDGVQ